MDPFLGEIQIFSFNFAPRGWARCDGQLLPISQNTALFSLLGTMYGGNGKSTFALPNLQAQVPLGQGQGPGLSFRDIGETGGAAAVTLSASNLPVHTHAAAASGAAGDSGMPGNRYWAAEAAGQTAMYKAPPLNTQMHPSAIGPAGQGQPHNNMPPYLVMNFCIALQGIFPSRP